MDKLRQAIRNALIPVPDMWDAGAGDFNYPRVLAAADGFEPALLAVLMAAPAARDKFFVSVAGAQVFKTSEFCSFIEGRMVDNSFTAYANRIGMSAGGKRLAERHDVVLDFPFKDCVLQGGQSNEEGMDVAIANTPNGIEESRTKRREIFFNEVLASDEITRLFQEKALTGWRRFAKDGEVAVGDIGRDADGVVRENMILRGNNLIALHSLRAQFAGKVKLIYIDPPYNTGKDSFNYNDRFSHSTWLTFMKNRLTIAASFLRQDGLIVVQCDDNEQAYLKVLMDEIFGRENFVNTLVWLNKEGGGKSDSKFFIKKEEYMHCFARDIASLRVNRQTLEETSAYANSDEHVNERGSYKLIKLNSFSIAYSKSLDYPITLPNGETIHPSEGGKRGCWRWSKEQYQWGLKNGHIEFRENQKGQLWVYTKQYFKVDHKGNFIERTLPYLTRIEEYSSTMATKEQEQLFGKKLFAYPKPEGLLCRIIAAASDPGDIVLDYHLGSGTTAAVAHKMGRQYIGIEQMDYVQDIAVERLKKVIAGEAGGVSKSVGWQGGGDFLYCELAQWNEAAKGRIAECADLAELLAVFDDMCRIYYLHYNVHVKKFVEEIAPSDEFAALSLDEQKRLFAAMLDLNMLYVPLGDMEGKKYAIAAEDLRCTAQFYGLEREGK